MILRKKSKSVLFTVGFENDFRKTKEILNRSTNNVNICFISPSKLSFVSSLFDFQELPHKLLITPFGEYFEIPKRNWKKYIKKYIYK